MATIHIYRIDSQNCRLRYKVADRAKQRSIQKKFRNVGLHRQTCSSTLVLADREGLLMRLTVITKSYAADFELYADLHRSVLDSSPDWCTITSSSSHPLRGRLPDQFVPSPTVRQFHDQSGAATQSAAPSTGTSSLDNVSPVQRNWQGPPERHPTPAQLIQTPSGAAHHLPAHRAPTGSIFSMSVA
jgi:hypothetical protein